MKTKTARKTATGKTGKSRPAKKAIAEPARKDAGKSAASGRFAGVFAALRELLSPFEGELAAHMPNAHYVYLESHEPTYKGRRMFFAAVRAGKNYVSYHLMPVYGCPELLQDASPELMKRMQGKACFNFTTVDERLFGELARLTRAGYGKFKSLKYL